MAVIRPRGFRWAATVTAIALAVLPISATTGVAIAGANDPNATPTATQSPVPNWGLDRIDQATLPMNNAYTYTTTAPNTTIFVIDTGINIGHPEFGGRAVWGVNTTGDGKNYDCVGQGTHLAGIAGGTAYGVAKGARLVAVKVIPCGGASGGLAPVLAGISWVVANRVPGSVALLAIGGSAMPALDQAVRDAVSVGVPFVVAAGNSNSDACNFSPGRAATALTVAATTNTDSRASFSNYGPCVDIFAPGTNITSLWLGLGLNTVSGTSQAAAFVAGVAAKYLNGNLLAPPAEVTAALLGAATLNVVTAPGTGSPNRLLRTIW